MIRAMSKCRVQIPFNKPYIAGNELRAGRERCTRAEPAKSGPGVISHWQPPSRAADRSVFTCTPMSSAVG